MPVPSSIASLSTTASANPPAGNTPALPEMDDHIRQAYAFIRSVSDSVGGKLDASAVSAFMLTVLDDASASSARTTLGAVGLTGNETVAGVKAFSSSPEVPNATTSGQAVNKGQLDAANVFASAAENAAGTVENKHVDPLGVREAFNATGAAPVYAARAWVTFDGTTGNVIAQGNVSGVVRNAPGVYTITFATAMLDASYTFIGGASQAGTAPLTVCQNASNLVKTTTQLGVVTAFMNGGTATNSDSTLVHVVIFR